MKRHDLIFRIFVSSTFADFVGERNALRETAFRNLERYCRSRGAQFQAVDLRWGVSEEASRDQQTMNLCLAELRRCQELSPRPNFILLLGDRYGWRPLPPQIEAHEFERLESFTPGENNQALLRHWYVRDDNAVPAEYVLRPREVPTDPAMSPQEKAEAAEREEDLWVDQIEPKLHQVFRSLATQAFPDRNDPCRCKYFDSATHQEIRHGALSAESPEEHVFAYLRTIDGLPFGAGAYRDLSSNGFLDMDAIESLNSLKRQLGGDAEQPGVLPSAHVYRYSAQWADGLLQTNLDALCCRVEADLKMVIDRELATISQTPEREREIQVHRDFGHSRGEHFQGRTQLLQRIAQYLSSDSATPLVLYGPGGCGKTALVARSAMEAAQGGRHQIIVRFVGATPASSNVILLLQNILQEADPTAVDSEASMQDYRELVRTLPEQLEKAADGRTIVLFLDALDQLSGNENAQLLGWLPRSLPARVKIVASVLHDAGPGGESFRAAAKLLPPDGLVEVGRLDSSSAEALLDIWLSDAGRTLQPVQRSAVLQQFAACGLPLYLRLAFEQARRWHSYDAHEATTLKSDIGGIITQFLLRLDGEEQHGNVLTSRVLAYLAISRHGLSEQELLEILSADEEVLRDFKRRSPRSPGVDRLPPIVWSRLHADLEPYLTRRVANGVPLMTFYHRVFQDTVSVRYLAGAEKVQRHWHLATCWAAQPLYYDEGRVANQRKMSELPFQQVRAHAWEQLASESAVNSTLASLRFIDAKCRAGMLFELQEDYRDALAEVPGGREFLPTPTRTEASPLEHSAKTLEVLRETASGNEVIALHKPDYPVGTQLDSTFPASDPVMDSLMGAIVAAAREDGRSVLPGPVDAHPEARTIFDYGRFVAACTTALQLEEHDILSLARNYARDGSVVEAAESALRSLTRPWFAREFRPVQSLSHSALVESLPGFEDYVAAVRLSYDGSTVVVAGWDELCAWNANHVECMRIRCGHQGIEDVALTPDGLSAATCGSDRYIRIWNLPSGSCRLQIDAGAPMQRIAMSADSQLAITWNPGTRGCGGTHVWNLKTGKCSAVLMENVRVMDVAITPDGRVGATVDRAQQLRIWDLEHCSCLCAFEVPQSQTFRFGPGIERSRGGLVAVCLSSDGTTAITLEGRKEASIAMWDTRARRCVRFIPLPKVIPREGATMAMTSNGRLIGVLSNEVLSLIDMRSGKCVRSLMATKSQREIAFSNDGSLILTAGADARQLTPSINYRKPEASICLWDPTGRQDVSLNSTSSERLSDVSFLMQTRDGSGAIVGTWGVGLCRFDNRLGNISTLVPSGRLGIEKFNTASAFPSNDLCVVGGSVPHSILSQQGPVGRVRVADLNTGVFLKRFEGVGDLVLSVAAAPNGRTIVATGFEAKPCAWDFPSGSSRAFDVEAFHVAFMPDSHTILFAGPGDIVQAWDLVTLIERWSHRGTGANISSLAVSPHGLLVAAGHEDGAISVRRSRDGAPVWSLQPHRDKVTAVTWTPDARFILSASLDANVKLLASESGECVALYMLAAPAAALSEVRRGSQILCGTVNGHIHLLRIRKYDPTELYTTSFRTWQPDAEAIRLRLGRSANPLDPLFASEESVPGAITRSQMFCCPWCGAHRPTPDTVVSAMNRLAAHQPLMFFPDSSAWDDAMLRQSCSECDKALRFTPFTTDDPSPSVTPAASEDLDLEVPSFVRRRRSYFDQVKEPQEVVAPDQLRSFVQTSSANINTFPKAPAPVFMPLHEQIRLAITTANLPQAEKLLQGAPTGNSEFDNFRAVLYLRTNRAQAALHILLMHVLDREGGMNSMASPSCRLNYATALFLVDGMNAAKQVITELRLQLPDHPEASRLISALDQSAKFSLLKKIRGLVPSATELLPPPWGTL